MAEECHHTLQNFLPSYDFFLFNHTSDQAYIYFFYQACRKHANSIWITLTVATDRKISPQDFKNRKD